MLPTNSQFLYMILVLPGLFGLTLIGEGVHKIFNEEWSGVISVFFGFVAIIVVIFAYLFFTSYLKYHA